MLRHASVLLASCARETKRSRRARATVARARRSPPSSTPRVIPASSQSRPPSKAERGNIRAYTGSAGYSPPHHATTHGFFFFFGFFMASSTQRMESSKTPAAPRHSAGTDAPVGPQLARELHAVLAIHAHAALLLEPRDRLRVVAHAVQFRAHEDETGRPEWRAVTQFRGTTSCARSRSSWDS